MCEMGVRVGWSMRIEMITEGVWIDLNLRVCIVLLLISVKNENDIRVECGGLYRSCKTRNGMC